MKEYKVICKVVGKEVLFFINFILMVYGSILFLVYVLEIFKGIRLSELEEFLFVLFFFYVLDIFKFFNEFIQLGFDVEFICRCFFFFFRIYFGQIISN